jgi:hypothetical protein
LRLTKFINITKLKLRLKSIKVTNLKSRSVKSIKVTNLKSRSVKSIKITKLKSRLKSIKVAKLK